MSPNETERDRAAEPVEASPPARRPRWWHVPGLSLIAVGTLWLLHQLDVAIPWEVLLPAALVVVGVLVLFGGRRAIDNGLVTLGTVLAVVTFAVVVAPLPGGLGVGERTHRVTEIGDLETSYGLFAGTVTVDLSELELPAGTTELRAHSTLGEVRIVVPPDVRVTGTGRALAGEVRGFGQETGGVLPRRSLNDAGTDDDVVLELDVRVGLGQIEVTR